MNKLSGSDHTFDKENSFFNKPGVSQEEVFKGYSEWAEHYDQDLDNGNYLGPAIAAEALATLYDSSERYKIRILDVAAGTGLVGVELSKRGFKNIDALEPSDGMLKMLDLRNVYSEKFQVPIGDKKSHNIPPKSYDALLIVGGIAHGHIPVNAINEMIRLVKAGGHIVFVGREEYLTIVPEYAGKMEPLMAELEKKGFWKQLSRTVIENYVVKKNGVLYKFEVTSNAVPM